MENFLLEAGIAATLFIGTNIDDIFVLLAFFSDRRFTHREIIFGQYVGIFILAFGSIALAFGAKQIPLSYIGLLGLVPLFLGVKKLWNFFKGTPDDDDDEIESGFFQKSAKLVAIIGVTLANGGDNVGVYAPLFATKSAEVLALYLLVFFVLTGAWCAGALYLIRHQHLGGMIKRHSHYVVPWVFIALGIYILYEAKSWEILF